MHLLESESTLKYLKDKNEEMTNQTTELNRKRKFSQVSQQSTIDSLQNQLSTLNSKIHTLQEICH